MGRSIFPQSNPLLIPIGAHPDLEPAYWDGTGSNIFRIMGNRRSGRTNLLRLVTRHIQQYYLYYGIDTVIDMEDVLAEMNDNENTDYFHQDARLATKTLDEKISITLTNLERLIDKTARDEQFARRPYPNLLAPRTLGIASPPPPTTQERVLLIDRVDLLLDSPHLTRSETGRARAAFEQLVELAQQPQSSLRIVVTSQIGEDEQLARLLTRNSALPATSPTFTAILFSTSPNITETRLSPPSINGHSSDIIFTPLDPLTEDYLTLHQTQ